MAYISTSGDVILVEPEKSEAKTNLKMQEVTDIEKHEWNLEGLKDYN